MTNDKTYMPYLTNLANGLLGLIYPSWCQVCGVKTDPDIDAGALCGNCLNQAKFIMPPTSTKLANLEVWTVCAYDGIIRECVHLFKYKTKTSLSVPLGRLMSGYINKYMAPLAADVITAVPLYWSRYRQRGYNQAELLAKRLDIGLPIYKNALSRVKPTLPQAGLSRTKRQSNLKSAFKADDTNLQNKNVLLVDDVLTTGSTLTECARTLRRAGARDVTAVVLAKGIQ